MASRKKTVKRKKPTSQSDSSEDRLSDSNQSLKVTMAAKTESEIQGEMLTTMRNMIREEVNAVIDKLQPQLAAVKEELKECKERLTDTEERITELEKSMKSLEKDNKELKEKAEKLEAHSRKFNLRVYGLDHDVEKGNPSAYMTNFFKEAFKTLPEEPIVEIAHRVGPVTKTGTRAMIVRMQRYATKEAILKLAREQGVITFQNMSLRIFPDLTSEVARKRAQFQEIREKLREHSIRHGIIHPATLIVTFKDEKKYFKDSKDAEKYFNTVIKPD